MARFLYQCASVLIRGFKFLLSCYGFCFHPPSEQVFEYERDARGEPRRHRSGWRCRRCFAWRPWHPSLTEGPRLRSRVEPTGFNLAELEKHLGPERFGAVMAHDTTIEVTTQ